MKKLLLFFAILTLFNVKGYSQAIVNDPLNAGINTVIQSLQTASNAVHDFMANAQLLQLAADGISNLKTVSEIAGLIDDLWCMTSEFEYYMNLQNSYSCASFLNYRLLNINLNYSTEILGSVVLVKNIFTMQSAQRISLLDNIKRTLESAIKDMQTINKMIRTSYINKQWKVAFQKRHLSTPASKTMAFNRYKSR